MKVEVQTITPEMAKKYLDLSKDAGVFNRLKRSRINRLKREMEQGRWMLNGQAIIIARSGKVLDGHHRLLASVETKRSFTTTLVTDADENALGSIDLGSTRNVAETLHLGGHEGKLGPLAALGKAAGWIINHETHGSPFRELPPAYVIEEWLGKHQDLEKPCMGWVESIAGAFEGIQVPKALVAFTFLAGALSDQREATEKFLEKLSTGYGIAAGDPVGVLRTFFLVDYPRLMNSRNKKAKPTQYTILGRVLKCLRASIDGTKIEKLTFTAKDPLPDLRQAGAEETSTTPVASTAQQASTTIPTSAQALVEHIEAAEASL